MQRGSLKKIKTMRDVRSSLDAFRNVSEASRRNPIVDGLANADVNKADAVKLQNMIRKEHNRFMAQMMSVERSRQGMLRVQRKLAGIIKINEEIMRVRRELQELMWNNNGQEPLPKENYKIEKDLDCEGYSSSEIEIEY